jgi:hypothetical protein
MTYGIARSYFHRCVFVLMDNATVGLTQHGERLVDAYPLLEPFNVARSRGSVLGSGQVNKPQLRRVNCAFTRLNVDLDLREQEVNSPLDAKGKKPATESSCFAKTHREDGVGPVGGLVEES